NLKCILHRGRVPDWILGRSHCCLSSQERSQPHSVRGSERGTNHRRDTYRKPLCGDMLSPPALVLTPALALRRIKMTKNSQSTYLLRLPRSIKAKVERRAKADGVSINQFVRSRSLRKSWPR